jgi:signal transduction histidine kinase
MHRSAGPRERRVSRWTITAATLCNVVLAGVAAGLIYRNVRARARQSAELGALKHQLEREMEERTRELVELSTHLQSVAEREKASLARELHDELGGLLVGARMDISWAEQHLAADDVDLKQRLGRVQQNLSAGIDLKRRIIEQLRPTLLDNVGFLAALRWQFKETCGRAGLKCSEFFPDEEPKLTADAAIALFRVAQEAFANVIKHSGAQAVEIALDVDEDALVFRVTDDGRGLSAERSATGARGVASMRHRVRALGGAFEVASSPAGGTQVSVRIPSARALRPVAETEPL